MAKFDFMSLTVKNPDDAWKNIGKTDNSAKLIGVRRKKVAESVNGALKQLAAKEANPKRGLYSTKGDLARVTVRAGNKILPIGTHPYNVVPAERAADFYRGVLEAVNAGEFDKSIAALYEGGAVAVTGEKKKRPPRSAEAIAKAKATRAANKAKAAK